jgi:hypothetical protein
MWLRAALLCAILTVSAHARADWQYTKWGMSPSELRAAAKKANVQLKNVTSPKFVSRGFLYEARYGTSKFDFHTTFSFHPKEKKLRLVSLTLEDVHQCRELASELKTVYGEPKMTSTLQITARKEWLDEANNNRIILISDKDEDTICVLNYESFIPSNVKPDGL